MGKDYQIKLTNCENKELVASLSKGVSVAKGDFIACMKADDVYFPTGFEEQLKSLEASNLDLCGSWVQPFKDLMADGSDTRYSNYKGGGANDFILYKQTCLN